MSSLSQLKVGGRAYKMNSLDLMVFKYVIDCLFNQKIADIWVRNHYTRRLSSPISDIINSLKTVADTEGQARNRDVLERRVRVFCKEFIALEEIALKKSIRLRDEKAQKRLEDLTLLAEYTRSEEFLPVEAKISLTERWRRLSENRSVTGLRYVFARSSISKREDLPQDWGILLKDMQNFYGLSGVNPFAALYKILEHAGEEIFENFEKDPKKATACLVLCAGLYAFMYSDINVDTYSSDVIGTGVVEYDVQMDENGNFVLENLEIDPARIDPDKQVNVHGHFKRIFDCAYNMTGIDLYDFGASATKLDTYAYEAQDTMLAASNFFRTPANATFRDPYLDYNQRPKEVWLQGVKDGSRSMGEKVNFYNLWENRIVHNLLLAMAAVGVLAGVRKTKEDWVNLGKDMTDKTISQIRNNYLMYVGAFAGAYTAGDIFGYGMSATILGALSGGYTGHHANNFKAHLLHAKDHVMKITQGGTEEISKKIQELNYTLNDETKSKPFRVAAQTYLAALVATCPAAVMTLSGTNAHLDSESLRTIIETMSYLNGYMAAAGAVVVTFTGYNLVEEQVAHKVYPAIGAGSMLGVVGAGKVASNAYKGGRHAVKKISELHPL